MAERDTYKYHLKRGAEVIHRGITYNFSRRMIEESIASYIQRIQQVTRQHMREINKRHCEEIAKRFNNG